MPLIQSRPDIRILSARARSGYVSRVAHAEARVAIPERGMLKEITAGLDSTELIELALLLIATGALSGFLAGCSASAAVPSWCRYSTKPSAWPVCRKCACRSASALRWRSSSRPRCQLVSRPPTRGAVDTDLLKLWWRPTVMGVLPARSSRACTGAAVQDRLCDGGDDLGASASCWRATAGNSATSSRTRPGCGCSASSSGCCRPLMGIGGGS